MVLGWAISGLCNTGEIIAHTKNQKANNKARAARAFNELQSQTSSKLYYTTSCNANAID